VQTRIRKLDIRLNQHRCSLSRSSSSLIFARPQARPFHQESGRETSDSIDFRFGLRQRPTRGQNRDVHFDDNKSAAHEKPFGGVSRHP